MGFLILTRMLGTDQRQRIAINVSHVVAVYPATDFGPYGEATEVDGSDIWTTLENGSDNACAWRVTESWDQVSAQVTRLSATGAAQ